MNKLIDLNLLRQFKTNLDRKITKLDEEQDKKVEAALEEVNGRVEDLSAKFHPINSVYISFDPTDPGDLFGGTWEQIQGRFLLAACEEYPVDSIGGEPTHKLTNAEAPSHSHPLGYGKYGGISSGTTEWLVQASYANSPSKDGASGSTGGNQPHNNMPPYLAVYMWRRVR